MCDGCMASLHWVSFVPTADCRAFRSLQAQPFVTMLVAQMAKDGTGGELHAAPSGHAELLQHKPRLLRSQQDGSGGAARGRGGRGQQPEWAAFCQNGQRGEGSLQWTNTHVTAADGSFHQYSTIQEHARTGEKSDSDAGHCAWWVEIVLTGIKWMKIWMSWKHPMQASL